MRPDSAASAAGGRLLVPSRMNQCTRLIAFRHVEDHLASTSAFGAPFAPMRGAGAHQDRQSILGTRYGQRPVAVR